MTLFYDWCGGNEHNGHIKVDKWRFCRDKQDRQEIADLLKTGFIIHLMAAETSVGINIQERDE